MAQHLSSSLKTPSKKRAARLPSQDSRPPPSLVLTGRRRDDHFRVDVDGGPIWLPCTSFKALVKLVVARLRSDSGLATISRLTVHRLRNALGKRGKQLIAIGSG